MNEMATLLRSILKEELEPIHKRLDGIEQRFDGMEQRFDGMEQRFDGMEQRFDGMEKRLNGFELRIDRLELSMNELKVGQAAIQKNIIKNIGIYTEKIAEHFDDKISALNKRIFNVETVIERIIKQ